MECKQNYITGWRRLCLEWYRKRKPFKGHHVLFPKPARRVETYKWYCLNERADLKFIQKSFIRALSNTPGQRCSYITTDIIYNYTIVYCYIVNNPAGKLDITPVCSRYRYDPRAWVQQQKFLEMVSGSQQRYLHPQQHWQASNWQVRAILLLVIFPFPLKCPLTEVCFLPWSIFRATSASQFNQNNVARRKEEKQPGKTPLALFASLTISEY